MKEEMGYEKLSFDELNSEEDECRMERKARIHGRPYMDTDNEGDEVRGGFLKRNNVYDRN